MDGSARQTLRRLVKTVSVGALGTVGAGEPLVSMVPVALDRCRILVHVSGLAPHTAQMRESGRVSLMLMQAETSGANALALPRVSFTASAREVEKDTESWNEARALYLRRHPGADMLFGFGDFALFELLIERARVVAGFGAAYDVSREEIEGAIADLLPLDPL